MKTLRCCECKNTDLEYTGLLSWDAGRDMFYIEAVHDEVFCPTCMDDTIVEEVINEDL